MSIFGKRDQSIKYLSISHLNLSSCAPDVFERSCFCQSSFMLNAPRAVVSVALVFGLYCTSKDYKYMHSLMSLGRVTHKQISMKHGEGVVSCSTKEPITFCHGSVLQSGCRIFSFYMFIHFRENNAYIWMIYIFLSQFCIKGWYLSMCTV